jgi:hypothetical protein
MARVSLELELTGCSMQSLSRGPEIVCWVMRFELVIMFEMEDGSSSTIAQHRVMVLYGDIGMR